MASDFTIREGTSADYDPAYPVFLETLEFHREAVPWVYRPTDSPPPERAFLDELVSEGNGTLLLAERGDEVVGFATVRVAPVRDAPYLAPRRLAYVDTLGVLAAYRRQGIARALMAAAETWAEEHGATEVHLTVVEFNRGAIALYEALGYETASREMAKRL